MLLHFFLKKKALPKKTFKKHILLFFIFICISRCISKHNNSSEGNSVMFTYAPRNDNNIKFFLVTLFFVKKKCILF
jgi:hypothetical protein